MTGRFRFLLPTVLLCSCAGPGSINQPRPESPAAPGGSPLGPKSEFRIPQSDLLRVVAYDAATMKLGVSTEKSQFGIAISPDKTNWVERARTWIIHGGTNEITLSLARLPAPQTTYVRLVK